MATLKQTIGFIGSGNMARAIASGAIKAGLVDPRQILLSDANPDQVAKVAQETGARGVASNSELVAQSDIVVISTKPYHVADVCGEVRDKLKPGHLFISICAGVKAGKIETALGGDARVVRVMPNTPALIGCGSAGVAAGKNATPGDVDMARQIFQAVGTAVVVSEDKLDLITGLTGSGPAYLFRFMESLIVAGKELGLSEGEAQALVPQMVLGSARMAVESGRSLQELREAVTTKGGTTEAGLKILEEGGFMNLVQDCVAAATRRSQELAN